MLPIVTKHTHTHSYTHSLHSSTDREEENPFCLFVSGTLMHSFSVYKFKYVTNASKTKAEH